MYRAFNLKNISFDSNYYKELLVSYTQWHKNDCKEVRKNIKDFVLSDKSLDGFSLQEAFFPNDFYPDVFISHSHTDENFAKVFAQYLENDFGIKSFIDSTVWGGFKELQNSLDSYFIETGRKYTKNDQYRVISHVHLMLNAALMQMINKCEAFFLLNTPHSITIDDLIGDSTYSPWIFSEIGMFNMVEKRRPKRVAQKSLNFDEGIKQKVDLSNFTVLENNDLNKWRDRYTKISNSYFKQETTSLDVLYDMKPLKNINNVRYL